MFKINWKRIILDEAHVIRNHKTQTCFAVCNITSICRWAITGTPIHNKEADFFTLLKFIRCKPFNNWTVSFKLYLIRFVFSIAKKIMETLILLFSVNYYIIYLFIIQSLPDKLRQRRRRFLVSVAQTSHG